MNMPGLKLNLCVLVDNRVRIFERDGVYCREAELHAKTIPAVQLIQRTAFVTSYNSLSSELEHLTASDEAKITRPGKICMFFEF
jgi:hypothetical protein